MGKDSWESVNDWYHALVGKEGHYFHQKIILPNVVKKILESKYASVIDFACGQGVLSRHFPASISYTGIDLSKSLIDLAIQQRKNKQHTFVHGDIRDLPKAFLEPKFDCCALILALQDIDNAEAVIKSASRVLKPNGKLMIVMNHPHFRIPRQSGWEIKEGSNWLCRWESAYMSEMTIPIQIKSSTVYHHHRPLSYYFKCLREASFLVDDLEEWVSDKISSGKNKKMENRARKEFPLFLYLSAIKN
jgi:ubiquinone/menaquinone biosynthesis C-methylase UbiE